MKKLIVLLTVVTISFLSQNAFGQDTLKHTTQITIKPYGAIAVAIDLKGSAVFFSFGGPKLGIKAGKNLSIELGFFPSIKIPKKGKAIPALGFGPSLGYKKWNLSVPFYYNNGLKPAIGIGLKF
ncbi:MAG: hypothetical protein AAB477_00090 [Patescibacteria group bacterium]